MEPKTILLVEDEMLIAMAEKITLEKNGYRVMTAGSGENAIKAVKTNPAIDLILMDIDLGNGIDGTEAAKEILREHDLPVVFLSSHTEPEIVGKTENITSYGYIVKNSGDMVLIASIKMAFRLFDARMKQKETENELRLHSLVLDQIKDHVTITDLNGVITYVNKAVAETVGHSREDILGQLTEIYGEDAERGATQKEIVETTLKEELWRGEVINYTADGREQIMDCRTQVIFDEKEKPVALCGIATNITAYKRTEESLRTNEISYKNVLEFVPVFILDREFRYLQVNKLAADLVQMEAAELVGKKITDLFPGFEESVFFQTYKQVMESRTPSKIAAPFALPDGTSGIYQVNVLPSPAGIQCIAVNISDSQKAEERLKTQLRFEQGIAAAAVCLLQLQEVSKNITEALGHLQTAADVARLYIFENFSDPVDGLCMRQTYEVCAPGVQPEIDNPVLQRVVYTDGFERWRKELSAGNAVWGYVADFPAEERAILEPQRIASMVVVPLVIGNEWRGFIGFDETRSYRVWQESEVMLLRTAAYLIGGYMARVHAEEALMKQLNEKEILLKETHHRIKNNISSIAGLLSLQAGSTENPQAVSALNVAISRVRSMTALYDKMLLSDDFQQIPVAVYLGDLTDSVIDFFAGSLVITVEKRFDDFSLDTKTLFPLGIILNELLTNTLKYAFAGRRQGTVRVSATREAQKVRLTVQDDGNGLPGGFDSNTPGKFGLTLVKMLSEQLGGHLQIESRAGTFFSVEFQQ